MPKRRPVVLLALTLLAAATAWLRLRAEAPRFTDAERDELARSVRQRPELVRYLRTGRIDINRAGADELQVVPGMSRALAERIARDRMERGAFRDVDDLTRVRGVGEVTLTQLEPWLEASPVAPLIAPAVATAQSSNK